MARVAIAMSGGVDSSVAAVLLKEQGHEVLGLHMKLYHGSRQEVHRKSCCSLDEALDARTVCHRLDIPFYVLDFQKEFQEKVIDYFIREYCVGKTPNPCVMCNRKIKSDLLFRKSIELDCEFLATGHYAAVRFNEAKKRFELARPFDRHKDQTYFLHGLSRDELPRLMFPLARLSKSEVREIAEMNHLQSAWKEESQDICFVPSDYRHFLQNSVSVAPERGKFVDLCGNILGEHWGLMYYTVGQRRGLGISDKTPFYVVRLDREKNQVVLGKRLDLLIGEVEVHDVNWVSMPAPHEPFKALVKLRYSHTEMTAWVLPSGGGSRVRVVLDSPQKGVSPGQAAVFYHEEVVLGGGWIDFCHPPTKPVLSLQQKQPVVETQGM